MIVLDQNKKKQDKNQLNKQTVTQRNMKHERPKILSQSEKNKKEQKISHAKKRAEAKNIRSL